MRSRLLPALLCLVPLLAAAQVYRWVDENGKVHYTDAPPPRQKVQATDIESKPTDPEAVQARNEARAARLESYRKERETEQQRRERQAQQQAMEEQRCADARAWLAKVNNPNARLYRTTEQGERKYYSREELAAAQEKAHADVEKYCG